MGLDGRVVLRKGGTAEDAVAKIPAIESGLGVRRGSVRVIPDAARADRFTLRVIEKDPHAAPVAWPGTSSTSITRPAELGLSEDGQAGTSLFPAPARPDRRHHRSREMTAADVIAPAGAVARKNTALVVTLGRLRR